MNESWGHNISIVTAWHLNIMVVSIEHTKYGHALVGN